MFDCSFAHSFWVVVGWDSIQQTHTQVVRRNIRVSWLHTRWTPKAPSIHTFIHREWWFITMVTEYKKERPCHSWSVATTKRKGRVVQMESRGLGEESMGSDEEKEGHKTSTGLHAQSLWRHETIAVKYLSVPTKRKCADFLLWSRPDWGGWA